MFSATIVTLRSFSTSRWYTDPLVGKPSANPEQSRVQVETGSVKTRAYVLPGIVHINLMCTINAQPYLQPGDGPVVLADPRAGRADQGGATTKEFGRASPKNN